MCDSNTLEKRNTDLSIQYLHMNMQMLGFDVKDNIFPNSPAHCKKARFSECENGRGLRVKVPFSLPSLPCCRLPKAPGQGKGGLNAEQREIEILSSCS